MEESLHRLQSVELIRNGKPWERSTGSRTPEGKVKSSRNADKGGTRVMLQAIGRLLRGRPVG